MRGLSRLGTSPTRAGALGHGGGRALPQEAGATAVTSEDSGDSTGIGTACASGPATDADSNPTPNLTGNCMPRRGRGPHGHVQGVQLSWTLLSGRLKFLVFGSRSSICRSSVAGLSVSVTAGWCRRGLSALGRGAGVKRRRSRDGDVSPSTLDAPRGPPPSNSPRPCWRLGAPRRRPRAPRKVEPNTDELGAVRLRVGTAGEDSIPTEANAGFRVDRYAEIRARGCTMARGPQLRSYITPRRTTVRSRCLSGRRAAWGRM